MSFFFSFSLLLSLSGWSLGAQRLSAFTYLPQLLRPEWEGALHLHSLGRLGGCLRPMWTEQVPCLGALLALCVNKGISASILSSLIHSFIHRCHFSCGFPWILWGWTLADSWDAYQRNDFKEPILLHLPIHRKVLNSLTCDVRFFFN